MLLEEEKSADFVFIPPEGKEAKERILTEHQKEVLKTKRFVVLYLELGILYSHTQLRQQIVTYV